MMMHDVVKKIVEILEANIPDPLNRNKKWIYDDLPRLDIQDLPRIGVEFTSATGRPADIQRNAIMERGVIRVVVLVGKGQKWDIDNDDEPEYDYLCLNDLAEKVKQVILSNQQNVLDVAYSMFVVGDNTVKTDGKIGRVIDIEVRRVI